MKQLYLFTLLISLFAMSSMAQENPRINKKEFFAQQEGLHQAKRNFKKAEKFYRQGAGTFDEALKYYKEVAKYNDKSDELNYKMAACHLFTSDKKAALNHLLNSSPEVATDYYLFLGRAYQYNLQYDSAKNAFTDYLESMPKWEQRNERKQVEQYMIECDNSAKIIADSVPVFINNLGPIINSWYDDYNAQVPDYDTAIYLTSKRAIKEPNVRVSRFRYKERMYKTNKCIDVPANTIELMDIPGSASNQSVAGIDRVEKRIFYYQGRSHNGKLYTMVWGKNGWKKKRKAKRLNHIAYKETTISIADNNDTYYITNRRGGEGGKDIWVSLYEGNHKFSKPKNLGPLLNTPFDEEAIHVSRDGKTLYFSSNGHPGMGGFDVYKSEMQEDGVWGEPTNMGHPINSPADELFYHTTANPLVSLYSTIRKDSYGGLDVYKIVTDTRIPFKLMGTVTDSETEKVIPAYVAAYDYEKKYVVQVAQVDTVSGMYLLDFEDVGAYSIQVSLDGYKTITDTLVNPSNRHDVIVKDYEIEILKHPFTLIGRVLDDTNGKPLSSTLTFLNARDSTVLGRAMSDTINGKFSVQFADKFDMIIEVEAEDYFGTSVAMNALNNTDNVIEKDILLKRSKIDYTLTGRITDEEGVNPVYAAISMYHPNEEDPFNIVITDSLTGKYNTVLDHGGPYLLEIDASGYFFLNETYQFPAGTTYAAKNFGLKKMDVGMKFVMENILFNTGKSTLRVESFPELDKLATLLNKNENVRIEISGHTDNVGSASVNKRISKQRALTVKNYLVSRGILEERIEYTGYGFEQPIAPNDTPEGRSQNRRVEVKILN